MNEPRVAHIGVAVASLADALPFYRDVLGLVPGHPETDVAAVGKSHIDLDLVLFGEQRVART